MAGTSITILSAKQFAQRMAALIPPNWASQQDKQPGGALYMLSAAAGTQLKFEQGSAQYALTSTRIQTAQGNELDLAGEDYFGDTLPRFEGESDDAYRQRLLDNLPPAGATRPAIANALFKLTGVMPRMIEPWNVNDTGAWDAVTYWDVDTVANPGRWGDGSLAYQGFIITRGPTSQVLGGNPLLTYDDGAFWDVAGYGAMDIDPAPIQQIYDLINRMKVFGTIVWVQITHP